MSRSKRLDPKRTGEQAEALKKFLQSAVIGQDEAIEQVVAGMSNYFAGLNDPKRPLSNLLFLGSTGVGKTYLVEKFAEHLLGNDAKPVSPDKPVNRRFMSRSNIFDQFWGTDGSYYVDFHCKGGDIREYKYDAASGASIEAGADPKDFFGQQCFPGSGRAKSAQNFGESARDTYERGAAAQAAADARAAVAATETALEEVAEVAATIVP